MLEYFYLLDYEPLVTPRDHGFEDQESTETGLHGSSDVSDTMSIQTAPLQYGHVYGTSAVSAFGGPASAHPMTSPYSSNFGAGGRNRDRIESTLTIHAIPNDFSPFGRPSPGKRRGESRSLMPTPPDPSPLATNAPNLVLHSKMYAAGDQYGVPGLKALALDKFKIQLTRHWDSPEFAEAIHIVYSSTPASDKEMREAVADTLGWHGQLLDQPEIEVAILEINGLAYELLKRSRRAGPEYD